jgi:hypothetical protein
MPQSSNWTSIFGLDTLVTRRCYAHSMTDQETTTQATTETDCGSHLVSLVTNQDQVVHNWVQLLVTIQAGLAVAVGFILKPTENALATTAAVIPWFAVVAIPILGIFSALALAAIIVHEQKWQVWFAQQFGKLPGLPRVFPPCDDPAGTVSAIPLTFIARVITAFAVGMCVLWIGLLFVLAQPPQKNPTSATTVTPTVKATPAPSTNAPTTPTP